MRAEPGIPLNTSVGRQLKCDQRTAAKYLAKYAARIQAEKDKLRLQTATVLVDDATKQRQMEVVLSRGCATAVASLLSTLHRLKPAVDKFAEDLARGVADGTIRVTNPDDVEQLISRYGRMLARCAETAKLAMEMERLRVGEPRRHQ